MNRASQNPAIIRYISKGFLTQTQTLSLGFRKFICGRAGRNGVRMRNERLLFTKEWCLEGLYT